MGDMLRRLVLVLVVGLLLGTCSGPSNTRVSGMVTIGLTCPLGNCPDRPMPGIKIIFAGASTHMATAITDSAGAYAITLAPGAHNVMLTGPTALLFEVSGSSAPPSESAKIHANSGQDLRVSFRLFSAEARL